MDIVSGLKSIVDIVSVLVASLVGMFCQLYSGLVHSRCPHVNILLICQLLCEVILPLYRVVVDSLLSALA